MRAPEFSRPERLDTIGEEARTVEVRADADERAAVAARFDLLAVEMLQGRFAVRRDAAGIAVTGEVTARVVQACAITGDPVPSSITEPVALRFVEPGGEGEDERELGADELDTVEIEGGAIDLGEAAAETMALALDPFPRCAAAEDELRAAGVLTEEEAKPAGALAGLKDLLGGGKDAG